MADEILKQQLQQIADNDAQIGTNDLEIKGQVNALRQYGIGVTGIHRDRLGDVVYDLADGYGGGGGGGVPLPVLSRCYKIDDATTNANNYKPTNVSTLIANYGFSAVSLRGGYTDAWIAAQKNTFGGNAIGYFASEILRASATPLSGYPAITTQRCNNNYPVIGYSASASVGNATTWSFLSSAVEFADLDRNSFKNSCTPIAFQLNASGSGSNSRLLADGKFWVKETGCYLNNTGAEQIIRAIVGTANNNDFKYATAANGNVTGISGGMVYYYLLNEPITVPAGKYLFWASEAIT